jgi:CHAT domain-containing protein
MLRAALILVLLGSAGCRPKTTAPAPEAAADLRQAQRLADARGDTRTALEIGEAIKCRALRERLRRAGAQPHALPEVSRVALPRMMDEEALLSFYEDDGSMHRYLARGGRVLALPPRPTDQLDPLLARTREELEHGDLRGAALLELLRQVQELILADLAGPLRGTKRLLLLPDGLLRYVPLHAVLRSRGQPDRFLVETLDVAYAPCLALFRRAGKPRGPAEIFAPRYGERDPGLEGARAETANILRTLGGSVRAGRAASPSAFEDALRHTGTVVHFAGHGLTPLAPGAPVLLFAEDEAPLGIANATRGVVRASLVTLGSCATAYGARLQRGERPLADPNLVEALLAAGAERVVAASWAVKDQQSAQQMDTFYADLRSQGPAAALAHAQRRAISRIRPPNPRFWAFYAVYGGW